MGRSPVKNPSPYLAVCNPGSCLHLLGCGNMLVILGVFAIVQVANGLILENGTYVWCGTTPEQYARHSTGSIQGGFDTIHPQARRPCSELTADKTWHRTYDGTCNAENDLGAAFSPVKRLLPPYYQDENSAPRDRTLRGRPMPSAREVSLAVHRPKASWTAYSIMLMQFGQYLDHDTSVVSVATEFDNTLVCCGKPKEQRNRDCYPITVPPEDLAFNKCIEFVRSDAITHHNGSVPYPRSHVNAITHWVDASNIYGSDEKTAKELRSRNETGALLKTSLFKGQERLPKGHDRDCINVDSSHYCSMAGDARSNEHPGLTAMHTVFHLEHNRQVRRLVRLILYRQGRPYGPKAVENYLNTAPDKIQERLYQVVRKVVGAVWQNIVYNEYLPEILGPAIMSRYELWTGKTVRYRPATDPSISEEFLACAFRFGHTLISDMLMTDKLRSLKTLFSTSSHNLEHYNKIVKGLVTPVNHAEAYDTFMVKSIVDDLFANGDRKFDLAALNIQRGRDHGLGRFNELRKYFGLKPFTRWRQFGQIWRKMKSVYRNINDVECFPGGTAERSVWRGVVGETFAHIIGRQFRDLKYADKYYFETDSLHHGFTRHQLRSLTRLCLSKILCENARLSAIQENPFRLPDYWRNPEYQCEDYDDVDMWFWTFPFVY